MSGLDAQTRLPTAADMRKKPTAALRMHALGRVTTQDSRDPVLTAIKAEMRKLAIAELAKRGVRV